MAMARANHGSYIFQREGSKNWWIKLRSGGKRIEKSLRTADKLDAERIAATLIGVHKATLLAARPRIETIWQHELEPGRKHVAPDGGEIIATDKELLYIGHNGAIIRTEPNGGPNMAIVNLEHRLGLTPPVFHGGMVSIKTSGAERPHIGTKNGDDAILETYLKHAKIAGYYEREARTTWALFKSLCEKSLKDADYDDGRRLVEHFEAKGLKRATIEKKIGWLRAAVRLNMKAKNGLKFNPFSNVISEPKPGDKTRRLPLDEADCRNVKRNFGRLAKSEQLLFRLLAATGMRLSEAFEIDSEMKERGVRYVVVGKKTEQSERRMPLPACVLPYLPAKINGPLFVPTKHADPADAASKRLNRLLDDIGITDPRKVVHSLRHRAQDRLRAAGCPEDVRWALLGHEEKTVAAGYGEGFPVPLLRKWVDKIGF